MTQNHLTSTEIASLWTQYTTETLDLCIKRHILSTVADQDIHDIIEYASSISESNLSRITSYFKSENHPVPIGFTKEDVVEGAPPLFDDIFWIFYLYEMSLYGINGYSLSINASVREDVRSYYEQCMKNSIMIRNKCLDYLLKKGVFQIPPYLPPRKKVEFVEKHAFLSGWFDKRPLNAIEITHLTINLNKTSLTKALVTGFFQVVQDKKIKDFMYEFKEVATSDFKIFQKILTDGNVPAPSSLQDKILPSSISPFSDKLIMFHITQMINFAIGYYGTALSVSARKDLAVHYISCITKLLSLAENGATLLIDNQWMEQPPMTPVQ